MLKRHNPYQKGQCIVQKLMQIKDYPHKQKIKSIDKPRGSKQW
ncbi:hypothetical protein LDG_6009 [Legionella drancourtii LLAP12]|uniref:Uncharacterized protein n=1 Tax=Legionella drancourtii LLAP12 TaxID=658187 RepID=G9ELK8_9GAMM|nr:hypothetical protein LDG_6009 [Legionella drancourtii LLAP12]